MLLRGVTSSAAVARCLSRSSSSKDPRRAASAPRPCAPPSRVATHDYGDDDEFYEYVARVEVVKGGVGRNNKKSSSSGGPFPSAVRLSFGGEPEPAVLVAVAVGRASFLSCAETGGGPTSLILEDDGAWPMDRSRRRAFSLSAGRPGTGGGDKDDKEVEDEDDDGGEDGSSGGGSFAAEFVAGSHLRLRGEARGLQVAISSAGGWPAESADRSWDAAVAMAAKKGRGPGDRGDNDDDDDDDAAAARALVMRRPIPSGPGAAAGAWRCFASDVPMFLDVTLADGSEWRGLEGSMVLDRRRGWGARGGGGGGKGKNAVAIAARRRRAYARAMGSPPWLRSAWEA